MSSLALSGCGDVPVRKSDVEATLPPKIAPIVVGQTDRATVRATLGQPWLASDYWQFDVFRVTDRATEVALIIGVPVWVGSDEVHGYVLVAYDERGKVAAHGSGVVEGDNVSGRSFTASSESSSALITAGEVTFAVNALEQAPSVFVSVRQRDEFLARPGASDKQCLMVIGCMSDYCETGIAVDRGPPQALPGEYVGYRLTDQGGSKLWRQPLSALLAIAPGTHHITVVPPKMATLEASADFRCAAGEVLYAAIDVRRSEGMHWKTALDGQITISREMPASLSNQPMVIWRDGAWLVPGP